MNELPKEIPPSVPRPWWVKFALFGLPNRALALASMWLLVWIAGLMVIAGFRDLRYSAGAALLLPACWYLKAIQWVDSQWRLAGKGSQVREKESASIPGIGSEYLGTIERLVSKRRGQAPRDVRSRGPILLPRRRYPCAVCFSRWP